MKSDAFVRMVSSGSMNRQVALVLILLCVLPAVEGLGAPALTPAGLYSRFMLQIGQSRPASFSCTVTGDAVVRSLARIPADARQGTPVVRTWYRRDVGQVIRVENVETTFRNLFSAYQGYLGMTGAWIESRGRSWQEFSAQYSMLITRETPDAWVARIASKGREGDSWGEFTFSKNDSSVQSARFFSRGVLVYSVDNRYGRIAGYLLPVSMTITAWQNGAASSVSRLLFSDYRVNISIPDTVFSR